MSKRDLNKELFGRVTTESDRPPPPAAREVSLSELAELSELTEEQAKVRVKVTHLATQVDSLTDSQDHSERRLDKLESCA